MDISIAVVVTLLLTLVLDIPLAPALVTGACFWAAGRCIR
jgi:hypothetical protein